MSNQINQIDTGIQDVASNLEQAFKPSNSHSGKSPENIPAQESTSIPGQNPSSTENSNQRYCH